MRKYKECPFCYKQPVLRTDTEGHAIKCVCGAQTAKRSTVEAVLYLWENGLRIYFNKEKIDVDKQ